jgi:hypothetical protein
MKKTSEFTLRPLYPSGKSDDTHRREWVDPAVPKGKMADRAENRSPDVRTVASSFSGPEVSRLTETDEK